MRNRSNMIFFLFYSIPEHWHITFILCCIIKILFSLHIILRSFMKIVPLKVYEQRVFIVFTGNFKAGPEPGTILKKLCPKEQLCFQVLMKDVLRPYVPEYKGHLTTDDGDCILFHKKNINYCKVSVILYYCSIIYA